MTIMRSRRSRCGSTAGARSYSGRATCLRGPRSDPATPAKTTTTRTRPRTRAPTEPDSVGWTGEPKRSTRTEAIVIVRDLRLSGGEAGVLRLHRSGGIDLIVSDDRRFLHILEALGIRYTAPGPLIAAMFRLGTIPRTEALRHVEKLGAFISEEEHSEARRAIEEE